MLCSKCGSLKAHRSRRRGARDATASLLQLIPYRCGACDTRFYARQPSGGPEAVLRSEPSVPVAAGICELLAVADEPSSLPAASSKKRRKPKGLGARLKELLDIRREKRIRIGTQLFIYGLALIVFLTILYGITQGGIPGL